MRAPFQLDLHVPNFNWPGTEPETLFEKLSEIATTAESSGFSSLSLMDHLHQIPGVGPRENYMFEGSTMLSAIAARTSTINLGLLVGGVMYHNPAKLAKITTTIDIVSGGRAVLGIGAGWFEEEHNAYGIPFPPLKERFERLEDTLNIARLMFTEAEASYTGTHHSITNALNNPKPLRGDIPILIGGSGERKTLRMVAQYADGSNFFGDLERVKHLLGVLEGHCEKLDRDPAEITKTRMARIALASSEGEAQRKFAQLTAGLSGEVLERVRAMTFVGDADAIAEQAQPYIDAGLDGFTIVLPDIEDLEVVAQVGEALGAVVGTTSR